MILKNQMVLFLVAVLLGAVPTLLRFVKYDYLDKISASFFGFANIFVFALTMFVAKAGASQVNYRIPWVIYMVSCVVTFLGFGMTSPLSLALLLAID